MKRLAIASAVLALIAIAFGTSTADLENQIFTSKPYRLRLVVPRGWRATDQPSYPGLLLWMMRQPEGKMVLSAEPFTRDVYCSWPVACRSSPDPLPAKLACALRQKLQKQRLRVGPLQAGPKENELAGLPSVWFDLDDGKKFVRQAVALADDRIVSLVLSAPSADTRSAHARALEQALRSLRSLTPEELGISPPQPATVARRELSDAGVPDAGADAAVAAATFESAPVSTIQPIGPCAKR